MSVYPDGALVTRTAKLSPDGRYRYALGRAWEVIDLLSSPPPDRVATFLMLNPSTADAEDDDPTVRRCVTFAQALGCNRLEVVNL